MKNAGWIIRLVILGVAAQLLSGCVSSMLATMAIKAPNQQQAPRVVWDESYAHRFDALYAQAWRLPVGPPAAELVVAVVEPGNYDFHYSIEWKENDRGNRWREPKLDWKLPDRTLIESPPARGTLLILHGYRDAKENVAHWALALAQSGYRCVLVDIRGHGRSSGNVIGFGAFEVNDLKRVLDDLQRRGLMSGRVGLLGVSYGASMGLLLAAQDERVGVIVALEPFSNAAKAVVEFAHGVSPNEAAKIGDKTFVAAVNLAGQRGEFSWSAGDVLAVMDRVKQPVLFYHGARDTWISPENSRVLQARASGPSRLVVLPDDDHVLLSMRLDGIYSEVAAWFDRYLTLASTPP